MTVIRTDEIAVCYFIVDGALFGRIKSMNTMPDFISMLTRAHVASKWKKKHKHIYHHQFENQI